MTAHHDHNTSAQLDLARQIAAEFVDDFVHYQHLLRFAQLRKTLAELPVRSLDITSNGTDDHPVLTVYIQWGTGALANNSIQDAHHAVQHAVDAAELPFAFYYDLQDDPYPETDDRALLIIEHDPSYYVEVMEDITHDVNQTLGEFQAIGPITAAMV